MISVLDIQQIRGRIPVAKRNELFVYADDGSGGEFATPSSWTAAYQIESIYEEIPTGKARKISTFAAQIRAMNGTSHP
jgi:hypothetical protein